MLHVTYDSETTVRNVGEGAVGKFGGNPFEATNHVVSYGEWTPSGYEERYSAVGSLIAPSFLRRAAAGVDTKVVGHNATFDLLYCAKQWPEVFGKALPFLHLWDTMQAEYVLSGQVELYPSLDACSAKRGLPLKDDKIKAYWDAGIDTPQIPREELLEYQKGDVLNTEAIYQDQLKQLENKPEMMELLLVKMDDLLFTMLMRLHGMQFDMEYAARRVEELDAQVNKILPELLALGQQFFPDHVTFDPASSQHVSIVVFGGELKSKESVAVRDEYGQPIIYKTGARAGTNKTRIESVVRRIDGFGINPKLSGAPKGKNGYYSTEADYIDPIEHPFTKLLSQWRELTKDVETYFRGYAAHCWPDGRIHTSVNHESTRTGRQSTSDPNLQNVSREE